MNDNDLLVRLAEIEGGYYRNGSAGPNDVLPVLWNPLVNDGEAMALVKKYGLDSYYSFEGHEWVVKRWVQGPLRDELLASVENESLNRAIVKAVVASKEDEK